MHSFIGWSECKNLKFHNFWNMAWIFQSNICESATFWRWSDKSNLRRDQIFFEEYTPIYSILISAHTKHSICNSCDIHWSIDWRCIACYYILFNSVYDFRFKQLQSRDTITGHWTLDTRHWTLDGFSNPLQCFQLPIICHIRDTSFKAILRMCPNMIIF